jgi:hypothetical protein
MLNASIRNIPLPPRLARRPVNSKGFPVPWFATELPGPDWDFVRVDPRKMVQAHNRKTCWLCGEPLGRFVCFVIGPMCSINRISAEPPSHRECAQYAVRACPFLARPNMRRNPEGEHAAPSGIALLHNPGATLMWLTKSYKVVSDNHGGFLFEIGEPTETLWFAEGRTATRAEIDASFAKGLPHLVGLARQEGPEALAEVERQLIVALKLLPAA